MADRRKKSPVPMIATVLSVLCAIAIGAFFLMDKKSAAVETRPPAKPVLEVAQPIAKPTATAVAPPTPAPTAAAPIAVADATTTRTAIRVGGVLTVAGEVRDEAGAALSGIGVYAVPYLPGGVQGSVRDAFRKGALSAKSVTDSAGNFEQKLNSAEAYYVGLLIDNEPQPFAQIINERGDSTKETVRLTMPKPFEVRGSVLDEGDLPVGRIPLKISWRVNTLREGDAEWQSREAQTDDLGRFVQALMEPAAVRVEIDGEKLPAPFLASGRAVEMTRTDLEGVREYRMDLRVISGVRIVGRVMQSAEGAELPKPLAGVTVTAERIAGDKSFPSQGPITVKSDDSGDFRFERLYPGTYRVTAIDDKFAAAPAQEITAGGDARHQFVLHPFSAVRGSLKAEGTKAGDKINVALIDRYNGWKQEAIVGDDGSAHFSFDAMKPGVYLLIADGQAGGAEKYAEQKVEHTATSAEVGELRLDPLGEVRARLIPSLLVKDFEDVAISAQPLNASADPFINGATHNDWRRAPATSLAEGGIVTLENMRSGVDYLLLVEKRATKEIVGSALASVASPQPIRIALQGTGTVSGVVTNDRGEACTNTAIELRTGLGAVQGEAPDVQVRRTVTDFKGRYLFPNVPSGQCRIALAGNEGSSRLVTITTGNEFTFDFKCRSYVAVTFKLKDEESKPFKDKEAFYIVPRPGTVTDYPVRELHYGAMEASLEPGNYLITRMSTLASKSFEVSPRLDGELTIDFTTPSP